MTPFVPFKRIQLEVFRMTLISIQNDLNNGKQMMTPVNAWNNHDG